ncbi:MAG: hypothetical protein ING75_09250 [Rhodocyclaceae bacterium]|nr:hypothetical protein [Rhodocyclaceae bacterium]
MTTKHLLVEHYIALHGTRPAALTALNAEMGRTYTLSRLGAWLNNREHLPEHVRAVMLPPVADWFASVWVPGDRARAKRIAAVVVTLAS